MICLPHKDASFNQNSNKNDSFFIYVFVNEYSLEISFLNYLVILFFVTIILDNQKRDYFKKWGDSTQGKNVRQNDIIQKEKQEMNRESWLSWFTIKRRVFEKPIKIGREQ